MENEVKEAVNTAISVVIIALVILMAVVFTGLSYKAYNIKVKTEAVNYNIKLKSELYNYFINPASNVSGVDIVDFITVYDKAYKYIIITGTTTYKLSREGLVEVLNNGTETNSGTDDKFWTQSYISNNMLKGALYSTFKGSIVDAGGSLVSDIIEVDSDVWLKFEIVTGK